MNIQLPHNWKPRNYQLALWQHMTHDIPGLRGIGVWHRRAGKDLLAINLIAAKSVQNVGLFWHIFPTYRQGRKVAWNGRTKEGLHFLDHFPKAMVDRKLEMDMRIHFKNGSVYEVVGTDDIDKLVGPNPIGCVFSEFALQDPDAWRLIEPILMENGGWALFISTVRGKNHFYDLFRAGQKNKEWFTETLVIEDTKRDDGTPVISEDDIQKVRDGGTPEAIIKQEYYCFPSGTRIWTDKGQKPIEKICVNDVVLSHAGRWRKVTRLYEHAVHEELASIKSAGCCEPLVCTQDHRVRICKPSSQTYQWIPAGKVMAGDYLVLPRLKRPDFWFMDSEIVELMAWFIAEGSVAETLIQFTIDAKEEEFASRITVLAGRFGNVSRTLGDGAQNIVVNSTWLADFMTTYCGSGAKHKRIPWQLIAGHEEILYKTLMDGDGCRGNFHGCTEIYTTISYGLALDVQMLAHMLGKRALVNKRNAKDMSPIIMGRVCNISDKYSVRISEIKQPANGNPQMLPQKHGVATLVTEVVLVEHSGSVFNIGVQFDESYLAEGRVVHNCDWSAALEGAIYGNQMDRMTEAKKICPVPWNPREDVWTYWDLGFGDGCSIVFAQHVGYETRIIDYYEASREPITHYARIIRDKPYVYGGHWGPWDLEIETLSGGQSVLESARKCGIKFKIVPKHAVRDGIEQVRATFPGLWIDAKKCDRLIEALKSYRYQWDDLKKAPRDTPFHDWASHPADAVRYMCWAKRLSKPAPTNLLTTAIDYKPPW